MNERRQLLDPDRLIERIFGDRRPATAVAIGLLLYGVLSLFLLFLQSRDAIITADPFTYLTFAQNLADGQFRYGGMLGEAITVFAENDKVVSGPIWNLNLLPGGEAVYTVAIGYPLFLAVLFKVGGFWLYTHVNILLLVLLLVLLFACVYEGLDRSLYGLVVAGCACLFLIRTHPETFLRFSHPWREPLFYCCVLGACYSLLRFNRSGRMRLPALAGTLLGYAVAIKEPNAVYAVVLGIALLCMGGFRAHPRKGRVLAWFVLGGVIGVMPLLVQNAVATGNPLLSLQFARATGVLDAGGSSSAISPAHATNTFTRYVLFYRELALFRMPFMLLALFGLVFSWRSPLVRIFLGLLFVHLVVYLQWGGADVRHLFFAHISYSIFLAVGSVLVCRTIARAFSGLNRFEHGILLLPLLLLSIWPSPWKKPAPDAQRFLYADARRLVEELESEAGPKTVFLSNRNLRDIIGIYSRLEVLRLHELAWFHPQHQIEPVLAWLREQGAQIVFLDNTDLDPRNVGRVDWSREDYEWLHGRHDLEDLFSLDSESFNLNDLTERSALTGYRVLPWSQTEIDRYLDVPEDGAAFLYLNQRSLDGEMSIRVNGQRREPEKGSGYYLPLHDLDIGSRVRLECSAGGNPVPALDDARIIGWRESIRQPCGADASPSDQWLFPGGLTRQPLGKFRNFNTPVTLRVPVRGTAAMFTTIGLGMNQIQSTNVHLFASCDGAPAKELEVTSSAAWLPVRPAHDITPWSGNVEIEITSDQPAFLKLNRVLAHVSAQALHHVPDPDTIGVGLSGLLTPTEGGAGPHPWSVQVNGTPSGEGRCLDDPRRSVNRFQMALNEGPPASEYRVMLEGAGLIHADWVEIAERLDLSPGTNTALFIRSGIHAPEGQGDSACWWTREEAVALVPVSAGTHEYRLVLEVADANPGASRDVRIRWGEQEVVLPLPKGRDRLVCHVPAWTHAEKGLQPLHLSCKTWVPRKELPGSQDDRVLGFQLFRLSWEPAGTKVPPAGS